MRRFDLYKFKIFFVVISLVINFIVSINFVSGGIETMGYEIGENECINEIGIVISDVLYSSELNNNDLLVFEYSDNKIVAISFDNHMINKYVSLINKSIVDYIKEDKLIYNVPILHNSSNVILREFSPSVPIVYTLMGNVLIDCDSYVASYGINNTLIEVNMNIILNMKVILPFKSENFAINRDVTLVSKIVHGSIPSTFLGNNGTNVVIPIG